MARPLRIEFPGAFYHVMNRGNTGLPIFRSERDREKFLEYVGKAVNEFGCGRELILRKGKKRNLARDVAIYLCREVTGETGVALGQRFDISGAGIAIRNNQIANQLEVDRELKRRIDRIKKRKINVIFGRGSKGVIYGKKLKNLHPMLASQIAGRHSYNNSN